MKKTLALTALTTVLALGAVPMASFAQGGGGCAPTHGAMHHAHSHSHSDRGGMKAFHRLNLSDAQREQMFQIRHEQAPELFKLRTAERTARAQLRDAGRAEPFDEAAAQQAAQNLGDAQGQLALIRAQSRAKTMAVLTDDQRAQLSKFRSHRRDGKRAAPQQSEKS
ncbi:MAG: Spy/CpxP family protein refolding chaperone [Alcaligenaceae bacterium]|nr:Spy/CpxP family protein refolding chaperone [Alcaligenaceae bacterium]